MSNCAATKFADNVLESAFGSGAVAIQPGNARGGQIFVQFSFDTFGTGAEKLDLIARTFRADGGNFGGETAKMAQHAAFAAVIGEDDGAVFTHHAIATFAADHETGEAAAIEQQHGLFACARRLAISFIRLRKRWLGAWFRETRHACRRFPPRA